MTTTLRRLVLAVALLSTASAAADDGIPAETLAAVKRATVYVRAEGADWKGTGSAFVVAVEKDSLLIATNHHVVDGPHDDESDNRTPTQVLEALRRVSVSVVFDPNTQDEASATATPIAVDPTADLAILRVARPKNPPTPIPVPAGLKLTETMPLYTFGFPFGQRLALTKGAPAITVGKGSISSLRMDDTGELAVIQIDGALNPGNSGGPVVDAKGRLVGVAVATIKSSQGIGLVIPAAELTRALKGRLNGMNVGLSRAGPTGMRLRVEVEVVDPSRSIRGGTLYCLPGGTDAKPGKVEPLAGRPGVKTFPLRMIDGVAVAEVTLDSKAKRFSLQAVPEGGGGAEGATRVRVFSLAGDAASLRPDEDDSAPGVEAGTPPVGWKAYRPKSGSYAVWIPAQARSQRERERNVMIQGHPLRSTVLLVETATGLTYFAQEVVIDAATLQAGRLGLEETLCEMMARELGGRVSAERRVRAGNILGKEYRIESLKAAVRLRVFVGRNAVYVIQVAGRKAQLLGPAAETFLTSVRIAAGAPGGFAGGGRPGAQAQPGVPTFPSRPSSPGVPAMPAPGGPAPQFPAPPVAGPNPFQPKPTDQARQTKIQGGFRDPEFSDEAPVGGILVGAEVGLGQFFNTAVSHAVRPVYRVGGRDVGGNWYGPTRGKQMVSAIAKPGYAVGAITIKNGLTVDGFSMTFMRVRDGRLDPQDSYESPWLGGPGGGGPVTLGGDGRHVVGLIGRVKPDAVTGLGLLFAAAANPPAVAGNPGFDPVPPAGPVNVTPIPQQPAAFGNPRPAVGTPPEAFNPLPDSVPGPDIHNPQPPAGPSQIPVIAAPAPGSNRVIYFLLAIGVVVLGVFVTLIVLMVLKNQKLEAKRRARRNSLRRRR